MPTKTYGLTSDVLAGNVAVGQGGRPRLLGGFVLAAGEGRRLRPSTLCCPKAAMPFCGVPLVELALRQVASVGVREVVVNLCHLAEYAGRVVDKVAAALPEIAVHLAREQQLLNTGGGLRAGLAWLPGCTDVVVHNADVVADFPLAELVAAHLAGEALATLLLIPRRGPCTVSCADDGRIVALRQPPGSAEFTFSGLYVIRRELLDYLPAQPAPSIVEAFEAALAAGRPIAGHSANSAWWSDLGTLESYLQAHAEALEQAWTAQPWMRQAVARQHRRRRHWQRQGVDISGASGLGRRLRLAAGSHLHDLVLWDGAVVADPLRLAHGILDGAHPCRTLAEPAHEPDARLLATLGLTREGCQLTPLVKQGSGRIYQRLAAGDGRTWVWSAYTGQRPENAAFAAVAVFLNACGIRVPKVLAHLPEVGQLLLQDLGDRQLLQIEAPAARRQMLEQTLEQAARLHTVASRRLAACTLPLQSPFTAELYTWERDYFRSQTLTPVLDAATAWTPAVEAECRHGQQLLLAAPQCLVHRDLQAANVMVAEQQAWLIDFQGLRLGVGVYDLASLLYDPYMCHDQEQRDALWRHYGDALGQLGGPPPSPALFAAAAVQRLLQALGAYGKLSRQDGLAWYGQFIAPGLEMLRQATAGRPEFVALHALASSLGERRL